MAKVLVTGGSGFVGVHCVLQLLAAGHDVRATVRSLKREAGVRAMLARGGWRGPAEQPDLRGRRSRGGRRLGGGGRRLRVRPPRRLAFPGVAA